MAEGERPEEKEEVAPERYTALRNVLEFTDDEIVYVIEELKRGKAPGDGKLTNDLIKSGKEILTGYIRLIFNAIRRQGAIPTQ